MLNVNVECQSTDKSSISKHAHRTAVRQTKTSFSECVRCMGYIDGGVASARIPGQCNSHARTRGSKKQAHSRLISNVASNPSPAPTRRIPEFGSLPTHSSVLSLTHHDRSIERMVITPTVRLTRRGPGTRCLQYSLEMVRLNRMYGKQPVYLILTILLAWPFWLLNLVVLVFSS